MCVCIWKPDQLGCCSSGVVQEGSPSLSPHLVFMWVLELELSSSCLCSKPLPNEPLPSPCCTLLRFAVFSQAWLCMPLISELGRQREAVASIPHASSRPVMATRRHPPPKKKICSVQDLRRIQSPPWVYITSFLSCSFFEEQALRFAVLQFVFSVDYWFLCTFQEMLHSGRSKLFSFAFFTSFIVFPLTFDLPSICS